MQVIHSDQAPAAIGTYSQAIRSGSWVFLSGQIPLDPITMELVGSNIDDQIEQVFKNLLSVAEASGGDLSHVVKLNIYLTDMQHFAKVNEVMARYFSAPYQARAAVGVAALPRGALVEMDGMMMLHSA